MIIIIKRIIKAIEGGGGQFIFRQRETACRRFFIFYFLLFLLFASFSYLRKSDSMFLLGLKEKLIYATRATRGHHNLGVSSNSTR